MFTHLMRGAARAVACGFALVSVSGTHVGRHRPRPALGTSGSAPIPVASFPFAYDDTRVFVPVRVAGSDTTWSFVFDTGAVPTIIDVTLATQLGLTPTVAGTVAGAGRSQLRQGFTSGVTFSVGGVSLAPSSVAVSPIDSVLFPFSGRRTPGVIGSQFFDEHVVDLDFDQHMARIYDPRTYVYRGTGAIIDLTFTNGAPIVQGTVTLPDGSRQPVRMVVDLGAKATMLVTEPFITRVGMRAMFAQKVRATLGAGVGGETRYDFVRVPKLVVGAGDAAELSDFVAGLSAEGTLRGKEYDALLGVEFLSRYHVILDYTRKRLILEPRAPAIPPAPYDMSGLYLIIAAHDSARVSVHRVIEGSPADQAGIRVGDVVESVDGQTAPGTSLWPWRSILRSGDGREVTVAVDRAGEHLVKTITLRRLV